MKYFLIHLGLLAAAASAIAGVPEPDVVFYGHVTVSPTNATYLPIGVTWSLSGNAETFAMSQTTVVSVNGETFYLTRIPFETRQLADNTPLPATPNTLSLPATATPYTRSATVDGRTAILPSGGGTFSYGATNQGLIERLDLVIGEIFAEWSQRIFGSLVSQTGDEDHDGISNQDEYTAGTDPTSAQSRFTVKTFTPNAGGGWTFTWDSVTGKTYTVERSTNLQDWDPVPPAIPGTGSILSITDTNPGPSTKVFYRVKVTQP